MQSKTPEGINSFQLLWWLIFCLTSLILSTWSGFTYSALAPEYAIPIENAAKANVSSNKAKVTDILQVKIKEVALQSTKGHSGCAINQIYKVKTEVLATQKGNYQAGQHFEFSYLHKAWDNGCVGPAIYSLPKLDVGQTAWLGFICGKNTCQWVGKDWALSIFDPAQSANLEPELYCEGLTAYYEDGLERSLFAKQSPESLELQTLPASAQNYAKTVPLNSVLHSLLPNAFNDSEYDKGLIVKNVAFKRSANTLTFSLIIDENKIQPESAFERIMAYTIISTHYSVSQHAVTRSDIHDCQFIEAELVVHLDPKDYGLIFQDESIRK